MYGGPIWDPNSDTTNMIVVNIYPQLRNGVADSNRWGLTQEQGVLISDLYQDLTFSVVLQEMLSGYFNTEKTLLEAYNRVIDLIPNYLYDQELDEDSNPS